MVAQAPPVEVEGRRAMCDGREGPDTPAALGHPKVYMNLVSTVYFREEKKFSV